MTMNVMGLLGALLAMFGLGAVLIALSDGLRLRRRLMEIVWLSFRLVRPARRGRRRAQ